MQEVFDFEDDKAFLHIPVDGHPHICRKQLVMTKDLFKECYKRWILEGEAPKEGNE